MEFSLRFLVDPQPELGSLKYLQEIKKLQRDEVCV